MTLSPLLKYFPYNHATHSWHQQSNLHTWSSTLHWPSLLLLLLRILRHNFLLLSKITQVKCRSCKPSFTSNISFPQAVPHRPQWPKSTSSGSPLSTSQPHCNRRPNQQSRENPHPHSSRSLLPRVLGQSPQTLLPTRIHLPWLHNTQDPRWQRRNHCPAVCHSSYAIRSRRPALPIHHNPTSRLRPTTTKPGRERASQDAEPAASPCLHGPSPQLPPLHYHRALHVLGPLARLRHRRNTTHSNPRHGQPRQTHHNTKLLPTLHKTRRLSRRPPLRLQLLARQRHRARARRVDGRRRHPARGLCRDADVQDLDGVHGG